jgi:hypothetical protein
LIIDYHEAETGPDGELSIHVGIQFEDEPDSLYVIHIDVDAKDSVKEWTLLFNGADCKYTFKPDEKDEVLTYLSQNAIVIHDTK